MGRMHVVACARLCRRETTGYSAGPTGAAVSEFERSHELRPHRDDAEPTSLDAYETVAFVTEVPFAVRSTDAGKRPWPEVSYGYVGGSGVEVIGMSVPDMSLAAEFVRVVGIVSCRFAIVRTHCGDASTMFTANHSACLPRRLWLRR